MLTTAQMRKKLDYARFTHLAGMFMIAMFIYLFSTIPHKFWVLLTVIVVSAAIEPGLIIRRAIHRLSGTFAALALLIPLLYLMQLNYRFIPVVFILSIIGVAVTSLNPRRYDISVFFITIMIFLLLAQTTDLNSPEGPVDMVANRAICTLIGVAIILCGDYFLFQSYNYSQKLYLFHQYLVYNFFRDTFQDIVSAEPESINNFQFIEKLRGRVIVNCSPIAVSSENLALEKNIAPRTLKRMQQFQSLIWDIRRLAFALCIAKFVLKDSDLTARHTQHFERLMVEAKANFINA